MSMDAREIISRLNQSGRRLSKGHQRIAEYIAAQPEHAAFLTAAALGRGCGVSESTVVRFAAAMGYEGYPELQDALQELVRQRLTASQRFAIAASISEGDVLRTVLHNDMLNIRRTVEALDQREFDDVVGRMLAARRIYVMGLRSAGPLAMFTAHYLHMLFDEVVLVQDTTGDVFEEVARIGPQDLLLGMSFPRYSTRTVECMRFAREHGAQVVALTDGEMSPLSEAADVCLYAHTDMASFVDSLAAPLSVVNALIVSLSLRRKTELADHLRQMEEIWNAQRTYLDRGRD